jgi:hypothetical protein
MMMKLTCLYQGAAFMRWMTACAIFICGAAYPATAKDSVVYIEQVGNLNVSTQVQSGLNHTSTAIQYGIANSQEFVQRGRGNIGMILQEGDYLLSYIRQTGRANSATVIQMQNAPPIRVHQSGSGNTIFVRQD